MVSGRYTKSLSNYHLSIPHKLAADGKFSTFHLPHFHDHRIERYKERRKRSLDDPEMIHYGIHLILDFEQFLLYFLCVQGWM